MTFKAGDTARYKKIGLYGEWEGLEGVVLESESGGTTLKITKPVFRLPEYPVGRVVSLTTENLELVQSFRFVDIQVGDKIRRTRKYESGALEVREGTVKSQGYDWVGQGNFILAYEGDDTNDEVTLELLERPKPKHWAEEKPVGSIALHMVKKPGCDVRKRFLRQDNGAWQVLYFTDKSPEYYSAEELKDAFSAVDEAELEWVK